MSAPPTLELVTSGSTGRPRRIRRTVESWLASMPALDALTGIAPGDLLWAPGPPASTLTRYAVWQGIAAGVPVLASGPWRGLPTGADRAAVVHAVPVVLDAVLQAAATAERTGRRWALRTAVVAGSALPEGLRERADRLGIRVVEYYGAAELSFVAVDVDGRGLRPFPGVEIDIRAGVLWARSRYLAETVDGRPVADADGWATVGDRATWRPDGTLRLTGRPGTADVAGHTVHLAEVEAVLAGVPGVAEAVCLAVADPRLGQRVVAVVRPQPGTDPRPALHRAALDLPPAARPARHHIVADLPRTPSGKVDRSALEGRWIRAPR